MGEKYYGNLIGIMAMTYPLSNTFGIGDRITFSNLAAKSYANKTFVISGIQPSDHNSDDDQYFDFEVDQGSGNSGPAHVEIFGGVNIYKNGVYEETVLVDVLTTEQGSSKTALGKTGPLSKPSLDIINITVTKSVAKITVNNHPYDAGDVVEISGRGIKSFFNI